MLVTDNTAICKRPQVPFPQILLAEHGLSCFIKVCSGEKEHSILMDAAVTPACLLNNANLLKVELKKIGAIVLSHGHPDHFLGLLELLGTASKEQNKKIPLFLHPDAFLERRMNIPAIGHPISIPAFDEGTLKEAGANIVKSEISSSIANDLIYTRGEIERAIDLKKDFPGLKQKLMKNGYLISSGMIRAW